MANIRILYDNKALNVSTLTASTTSGTLVAGNLILGKKSKVWRATGKTATLTLTWTSAITANMACLAFCNFSPTATLRARGYTNVADASPAIDSGAVLCCAYQPLGLWGWGTQPLGVNAFSYGGGAYARVFFADTSIKKLVLDIDDSSSTLATVEAANLVVGAYWSPEVNPDFGASLGLHYSAQHKMTEAGDLVTDIKPQNRMLKFDLNWIKSEVDRMKVYEIMTGNGMVRPVYVNLYPNDPSPSKEQSCQIYCKLSGDASMSHPRYGVHAAPFDLKEV